ncbi:hypothetical protein ACERZ8_06695 [Tateyamaria armeniaca]|uniref:Uncharacterized protein n=1 Tax=Tateyamaria armeniaca TaxID=2518930 RepID=A0ABW8UV97_9RHOB
MSTLVLTPTKMRQGIWEGVIKQTGSGVPQIRVTHLDVTVPEIDLTETGTAGEWLLEVPIPMSAISEGVQVFVISDALNDETLGQFTLIAGEVLGDDLRAEVELLRAELDMLKRAFRRHCTETS